MWGSDLQGFKLKGFGLARVLWYFVLSLEQCVGMIFKVCSINCIIKFTTSP